MTPNRDDIVAAAFAAGGPGSSYDPMRAQKLVFLIDREVADWIGGPFFRFQPYYYGPFDRSVYDAIRHLVAVDDAKVDTSGPYHRYHLTESGHRRGAATLAAVPPPVADYFGRVARWVRLVPYRHMLAAIYRQYPDMAVNSVVRHFAWDRPPRPDSPFGRGMARAFDFTGITPRSADSAVGLESDLEAMRDDWRTVGECVDEAMVRFGETERFW